MRHLKQIVLLLLIWIPQYVFSLELGYQTTQLLIVEKPGYMITSCNWSCTSSNISFITRENNGTAIIEANKYFSGSVTVSVSYRYESGVEGTSSYKSDSSNKSWIITCVDGKAILNKTELSMKVGQKEELTFTWSKPIGGTPVRSWSSSNTNVATVNTLSGEVIAVGKGTATITLNPGWGPSATCKVTVEDNKPTSIRIPSTLELRPNATQTLSPTVTPSNSEYKLTWKSSNTNIATVSQEGLVRGISDGSTYVTVTTDNNLSSSCYVSVIPYPTSISFNEANVSLKIGATKRLTYSLMPSNAQSNITWQSSNPSVVTINTSGIIEAKAKGTATITCTTENGKTASLEVSTFELRDVDGDGEICVADLSAIVKYIRGKGTNANFNVKAADVNEDGVVNEEDLRIIEDMIMNN